MEAGTPGKEEGKEVSSNLRESIAFNQSSSHGFADTYTACLLHMNIRVVSAVSPWISLRRRKTG